MFVTFVTFEKTIALANQTTNISRHALTDIIEQFDWSRTKVPNSQARS